MKKNVIRIIVFVIFIVVICLLLYKPNKDIKLEDLYKNPILKNNVYEDYIYDEYDRYVTIVSYNGDEANIEIPNYIKGKPVLSIEDSAFYGNTFVKKIIISNKVKKVGHQSFIGCSNLEEIYIPFSVEEFGDCALDNTFSLKKIVIDKDSKIEDLLISNGFKDIIEYKK